MFDRTWRYKERGPFDTFATELLRVAFYVGTIFGSAIAIMAAPIYLNWPLLVLIEIAGILAALVGVALGYKLFWLIIDVMAGR